MTTGFFACKDLQRLGRLALLRASAKHLERWQSGRMRWTRNPVYVFNVPSVRIRPSPPILSDQRLSDSAARPAGVACPSSLIFAGHQAFQTQLHGHGEQLNAVFRDRVNLLEPFADQRQPICEASGPQLHSSTGPIRRIREPQVQLLPPRSPGARGYCGPWLCHDCCCSHLHPLHTHLSPFAGAPLPVYRLILAVQRRDGHIHHGHRAQQAVGHSDADAAGTQVRPQSQ
jgi:hypothetical protein